MSDYDERPIANDGLDRTRREVEQTMGQQVFERETPEYLAWLERMSEDDE